MTLTRLVSTIRATLAAPEAVDPAALEVHLRELAVAVVRLAGGVARA